LLRAFDGSIGTESAPSERNDKGRSDRKDWMVLAACTSWLRQHDTADDLQMDRRSWPRFDLPRDHFCRITIAQRRSRSDATGMTKIN